MTILNEVERKATLVYFEMGWSYQEIVAELSKLRMEKIKWDMQEEVVYVIAHRFSTRDEKSIALREIKKARLPQGDINEPLRTRPDHMYPKTRAQVVRYRGEV